MNRLNVPTIRLILIIFGSVVLLASLVYFVQVKYFRPAEYTVSPGGSIQSTLDKMSSGEICHIRPGFYQEALTIPRSGLTICNGGKGPVILDGGGTANTILMENVSHTTIEGLVIQNSAGSLVKITGSQATNNTIKQCTLLEWGLDGVTPYAAAISSEEGASYTTVDLCYIDRGNHEAIWTQNPEAISFRFSGGHHLITNNIIWGVCRDSNGNPIKLQGDFGDGYPLYKFNLFDGIAGEDGNLHPVLERQSYHHVPHTCGRR
jgi:hypothetical protein